MFTAEDTFYKVSKTIHEWAIRSPFDIRFRPDGIYHHQWHAHVETPVCTIGECVVGLKMSEYYGNSTVYKTDPAHPMFIIDHKTKKVTVYGEIDPMYRDLYEAIVNTFKEENEMNKAHIDEVLANAKIIDSALEPIGGDCQPKTFLQKLKACLESWWITSHWNFNKTHESVRHLKYQFGTSPIYMLGILEHASGSVDIYTENNIRNIVLQIKDGKAFPSLYSNAYFTNGWAIIAAQLINDKLFTRPTTSGNLITDEEVAELKAVVTEFKNLAMKQEITRTNKILKMSDNVVSISSAPEDDLSIEAKEILKKYTYVRKGNKVMLMKANTVMPAVNQVHFNKVKGYTTVLFVDGTKTTTKGPAGDEFDPEIGYAMCIMKRMHGNRSRFKKVINEYMKKSEFRNTKIQKKVDRKNKKTDDTQPPTHELF